MLDELGDDGPIDDEVDQRDVANAAANYGFGDEVGKRVAAVANYLWDIEQGGFECGGAGTDDGGVGGSQQGVGLVIDNVDVASGGDVSVV